jgi:dienelactone hydrolase
MKKFAGLFFLLFFSLVVVAQDDVARAEKFFRFVTTGMGDSLYQCLNDKARASLSVEMLNGLMQQLEPIYGKYSSHASWQTQETMGTTIYYCDAQFDKGTLRFLTAFDSDGRANTLRFIPAESKTAVADALPNSITEQAITVVSGTYKLPGTLTLPKGKTNVPFVVLVHGSGPNDRDETIGPNKPFRDLAWDLAEKGVAVLRYDKRTKVYGQKWISSGEEANLEHETVDDAVAAVALAMKQKDVNPKRVYIIGHSMGAMLAPRIAERIKGLCGIIIMAGNARPLEDLIVEQMIYLNSQNKPTVVDSTNISMIERQAANVKRLGTQTYDEKIGLPLGLDRSYWADVNNYDQLGTAAKLTIPMLILQGVRDYQVRMTDFALWRRKLKGHRKVQFKSYSKLNHLFMEGIGLSTPAEYMTAKHIPGYVTDDIVKFINHEAIE